MNDPRPATVYAYHQRTKHSLQAYAKGPQYLDWDQQPNPFRRFAGAALVELPLTKPAGEGSGMGGNIAALLELSMGLSAWKQYGPDRWALRCNPSSGNLHPTECYIVTSGIDGLGDGVYHYAPHEHALELRGTLVQATAQPQLLLGFSSIAWREAWKYGERAFRYVQLDVGHALGAMRYAAAVLGWQIELLPVTDAQISALLGLDRAQDFTNAETEHPDLLLRVVFNDSAWELPQISAWFGTANALGGYPRHQWTVIDDVTAATAQTSALPVPPVQRENLPAQAHWLPLIRQRRSAQAFTSKAEPLASSAFFQMLQALLPESGMPWDVWTLPTRLHPLFFVHRVDGLPAGLYALPRTPTAQPALQAALSTEFIWEKVAECPADLPLYRLLLADARKAARTLSCHQDIASTSAFSLGMLAEFDASLQHAASLYRQLYWEAGLLGQVLYLEAERHGVRGTGIGCFFDDNVHEVFGIKTTQWQSLYHFTVGTPVVDSRIQTLPPYAHLPPERQPES